MMPTTVPHCSAAAPGVPCWWSEAANPADTETSTAQTVRGMCDEIGKAKQDPHLRAIAHEVLERSVQARDPGSLGWAAFFFAKHRIVFVPDEITLGRLLHKYGELDFLQSPSVLARQAKPEGDCDCFTMMVCALLEIWGCDWRICTLKCDARDPARWSHVYCCVMLPGGDRLALDASHGFAPGWEVPAHDVFEYAEWDKDGRRLPTKLRPRPMGQYRAGLGMRAGFGGRGLGQDDGSGGATDSLNLANLFSGIDPNASNDILMATQQPGAPIGGGSGSTSSGSSSPAVSNALANLATSWTKIAGQVIAPQATITGPGGTMITGPAGSVVGITQGAPNLLSSFASLGTGVNFGNLFLLGGIAVVVVIAIKAASGK